MKKKIFPIFLIMFVLFQSYSQKAVYKLPLQNETTITNPTFFYTLPKTAFKVDIIFTKTTHLKGLYADFAEKMLGITNYCTENITSFKLKNTNITPCNVPDENLQFVVELSSVQIKNNFLQSLFMNNSADFQSISKKEQQNSDFLPEFFKNYADAILQQTYETYTDTKIIDGVVTQIPVTQTKISTKTLSQQAQEAVDFIEKIRTDRYAILSFSQETSLSKEAFEYLVNQLDDLEKKYLELFTGITIVEDIHETFVIFPDAESFLFPLCSVTPTAGFSTSMCKTSAYNYYLKCEPQLSKNLQVGFKETMESNPKYKANTGYSIRKAIPVLVSLVNGDTEELLGIFSMYQFGWLETLPANLDSFEIEKWGYIY
ncbi:MAG: DUF4831 family protein [Lentimicrobiaceae bacterium]|nr:DUF4831 family protein [Lentimicrobiaceae bacterium]